MPIAVLISGGGRSLKNLIDRAAEGQLDARIVLVVSSHADAAGLRFAHDAGIPTQIVSRRSLASNSEFSERIFTACRDSAAELVVMAGFIKYVPIPADFQSRVINIHPALIPQFCGRGFYGMKVHEAVLRAGAAESGCTVHYADDQYDHGPIILQRTVPVLEDDTPEQLAARVFEAECEAYPAAIQEIAERWAAGNWR